MDSEPRFIFTRLIDRGMLQNVEFQSITVQVAWRCKSELEMFR